MLIAVVFYTMWMKYLEVESRTQGSRPRTQKKSEAKVKDSSSDDRPCRGQGQECSRPRTKVTGASVLQQKKIFSGNLKKKSSKKFLLVLNLCCKDFCVEAYADDLAVSVTGANMLWTRGNGPESNKHCCKLGFGTRATV